MLNFLKKASASTFSPLFTTLSKTAPTKPPSPQANSTHEDSNSHEEQKQDTNSSKSSKYYISIGLLSAALLTGSTISASKAKLEKNQMENRVHVTQFAANRPMEDRFNATQISLKGKPFGFYAGVFDGHGGWQVAEYAKKNMHVHLTHQLQAIKGNITQQSIVNAIENSYDQVENEFLQFTREAFAKGYARAAYVGACALVSLIHDHYLYVANAGDCKAVLFKKLGNGSYIPVKASKTFNAMHKSEQKRLLEAFPDEEDIFICKHPDSCYVKGNLQCTRSLGDFRLKHKEFNTHEYSGQSSFGYRNPLKKYTGPYITHKPDIKIFKIDKQYKFLVLGSDGIWDEVLKEEAAMIIKENEDNPEVLSKKFFEFAMNKIARRIGKTPEQVINGDIGFMQRRSLHDDITVMVIDLQNQV